MLDFTFWDPTRIIFGKESLVQLGKATVAHGKKALLLSGKSSARSSGLYTRAVELLKAEGVEIFEFPGIRANPLLSDCRKAIEVCRKNKVNVLVSLGGGSVNDTAKVVAFGVLNDGELLDYFQGRRKIENALPLITVMTVAATGSEFNSICVIRDEQQGKKYGMNDDHLFPRVSILDPQLTFTLSPRYSALGAVDILTHILEPYVDAPEAPLLQARMTEALVKTVMESAEAVRENPRDYEARSYLMVSSALALNGLMYSGSGGSSYPAHQVSSELEGLYDTPHGAGLSVMLPAMMRFVVEAGRNMASSVRFAEQLMRVERTRRMTDKDVALEGIKAFRRWIKSIGNPTTLAELGIKDDQVDHLAERIAANKGSLSREGALEFLRYAL